MNEAPSADAKTRIRSFRVVFALEHRIHRIDRWRLPVPYGVPVRGIGYAAAALAAILAAGSLPVLGNLIGALPPPVRLVIAPAGLATLMIRLTVDGRPAHRHLVAVARQLLAARDIVAFRPTPGTAAVRLGVVTLAASGDEDRYRRAVVRGPARVLLRYPFRAVQRGRRLTVTQLDGEPLWRGKEIVLSSGQELVSR
jgi:hypothetical protein